MPGPADALDAAARPADPARLEVAQHDDHTLIRIAGDWRRSTDTPSLNSPATAHGPLSFDTTQLSEWDTRLAAELWSTLSAARQAGRQTDLAGLPEGLRAVLELALPAAADPAAKAPAAAPAPAARRRPGWITQLGLRFTGWWADGRTTLHFIGEVLLALGRMLLGRSGLRWRDLAWQLDQTGPRSLPIVSLVSFLVGLILAYMGAAQLQRFGAQIYIADLVTIGVVREIAALMTGIILSGRVGAAFAAQLGSMQANEEVDALRTLGIAPIENLVLPRLIAMVLVAPLLTAYAALVGCMAGMLVAVGIYGVVPLEYLHQSLEAITLTHIGVGLLKGTVYAALVALAGCRQGLFAGRSAQAVGDATTAAVVQSIVWIVVAASALTIAFQRLDI